jgi:hypothetical protein
VVLRALAGLAAFIGFCVVVILAVPYYAVIRLLAALHVIDLEAKPSLSVRRDERSCLLHLYVADSKRSLAASFLERLVSAFIEVRPETPAQFYRTTADRSCRISGPFTADAAAQTARIAESVEYLEDVQWWLIAGDDVEMSALHEQMDQAWSEERDSRVGAAYIHAVCAVDQSMFSAEVLVYGPPDYLAAAEKLAVAFQHEVEGLVERVLRR